MSAIPEEDIATPPAADGFGSFSALSEDIEAAKRSVPQTVWPDSAETDAMLRAAGRDPGEFSSPREMAALPQINNPDIRDLGYSDYQMRSFLDRQEPEKRLAYTALMTGRDKEAVIRDAAALFEGQAVQDIAELQFTQDDAGKIARDLGQEDARHVEELLKTDDGKKRLEQLWTQAMTTRLVGKNSELYMQYAAQALDADSTVLLADFQRGLEDSYGGTARLAYNLGADFTKSALRGLNTAFLGTVNAAGRLSRWQNSVFASLNPEYEPTPGPYTPSPDSLNLAGKAVDLSREQLELGKTAFYSAEPTTGSFLYDSGLQPVAGGIGSMATFWIAGFAGGAPAVATSMWASGREQVRDDLLASGVTEENADLVADITATPMAAANYVGFDKFTKYIKASSPGGKWLRDYFISTLSEATGEGLESVFGSIGAEIGRAVDLEDYEFDAEAFIEKTLTDAVRDFTYGGLAAGVVGGAAGNPGRTIVRDLNYRNDQSTLSRAVAVYRNAKGAKTAPDKMNAAVGRVMEKAGAPSTMFINADEFRVLYQDDARAMDKALADADVTRQDFEHALAAGADIEVSTAGLARHVAEHNAEALQRLARSAPDAPTGGVILAREQAKAEVNAEFERFRQENTPLPDAFAVFRQQLMDAGHESAQASYETDLLLAGATVAGRRLGVTPEQFLALRPVQVSLANSLQRARSVDEVVGHLENFAIFREAMAAQEAYTLAQSERKGELAFALAPDGGLDFGTITPEIAAAAGMESVPVRLEEADKYGKGHLSRPERLRQILDAGFASPEEFVSYVVENVDEVRRGRNDRRILVAQSLDNNNLLVLELARDAESGFYTVISGWPHAKGRNIKGETLWAKSDPSTPDSGDPSSLSARRAGNARDAAGHAPGSQSDSSLNTIPAEEGDVKWRDESVRTVLEQAGVEPEQAAAFTQYIESVLAQGGDLADAQTLARQFRTANDYAEGMEQAALGLERLLERPEGITAAVLEQLDLDPADLQAGIAEMRARMEQKRAQAADMRKFYQNPDLAARIQDISRQPQNRRGDITFTPDAAIIRLFNGRQDRSTVVHELFHYFYRDLELAAKRRDADSQTRRDYIRLNEEVGGGLTSADAAVRSAAEERAAALWERYLMEGRAPSPDLTGAFRRFRTWLTNIYRAARNIGDIDLRDDVRMIFDRMLAGEEEVAQARRFYDDLANLSVSDAIPESARPELEEKALRARVSTEERHIRKIVREHLDAVGGRKAFRERARREVGETRQFRAIRGLKDTGGLTRADTESEIGAAAADRIAANHRGVVAKKERTGWREADMAALAAEHGYDSQYDMVRAIVEEAPGHALPTDEGLSDGQRRALRAIDGARTDGGLDELYVIENFGASAADRLRADFGDKAFSRPRGKVGAIIEAERRGYDSLANMLDDIAQTPSYREAVNARTEQMIAAEEAEIRRVALEDAATAADEAYHDNDEMSDYFAAKQRVLDAEAAAQALRDGRRADRMLSDLALREMAAENALRKDGRKAGQYHVEVEAFKRHGKNAAAAERKGDFVAAAKELRMQRLAHYGIREAVKAREYLDGRNGFAVRYQANPTIRRLEGADGRPKVEFPFREAIKKILNVFKVTNSARLRPETPIGDAIEIPGRQATPEAESFLPALSEAVPAWIVNREGADGLRSWRDLTMERIRELDETVRSLERIGHGALEALKSERYQTIEQMKRDSIGRMDSRSDRPKEYDRGGGWGRLYNSLDRLGIRAFVPEFVFAMADGNTGIRGLGFGPLQRAFARIRQCEAQKAVRLSETRKQIAPALSTLEAFRKRFGEIDQRLLGPVPEALSIAHDKRSWTAEMVVMTALNSGNAGNLKALLEGYDISRAQWERLASAMTSAEWGAVQTIWDAIGSYFPEIDAVTFRLVNRHVKRVEALPLTVATADGQVMTLNGGYFPLIFDSMVDADYGRFADVESALNRQYGQSIHGFARVADSFTKTRQMDEKTGEPVTKRPPLLELNVIVNHLDKVAHYVAMADVISEFDRLTLDEEWAEAFTRKFGEEYYSQVRKWLKYQADPDAGNLGDSFVREKMEWLRHKATTAALGLRFWTGLKQRYGYFEAITHLSSHSRTGASGLKYLVRGIRSLGWSGNAGLMNAKIEEIFAKSVYMKARDGNVTADMREMLSRIKPDAKVYSVAGVEFTANDVNNAFFTWIQMNDRAGACAVWLAAYQMALDGNGSFDPAGMTAEQLETAAIMDADMAAATQASSFNADLTAWQRDKGVMRLFTSFISGNIRRSSRAAQYWDAMRRGQIGKSRALTNFVIENGLQAWIPAFMAYALRGLTGDDDDDPSMWDYMGTIFLDPIETLAEGIPFVNQAGTVLARGKRSALPPALDKFWEAFARLGNAPSKAKDGKTGEAAIDILRSGLYAAGIPLETPVRDATKALEAVGLTERKKR